MSQATLTPRPPQEGPREWLWMLQQLWEKLLLFSKFKPLKCPKWAMTFVSLNLFPIRAFIEGRSPISAKRVQKVLFWTHSLHVTRRAAQGRNHVNVLCVGKVSSWIYILLIISEPIWKMPCKYSKFSLMLLLFSICTENWVTITIYITRHFTYILCSIPLNFHPNLYLGGMISIL